IPHIPANYIGLLVIFGNDAGNNFKNWMLQAFSHICFQIKKRKVNDFYGSEKNLFARQITRVQFKLSR
ncbi:MAG: hypothetical protein LBL24_02240, partial [Bacteroidales bacterium]|nr:hypothetical protein [Bacteroidales bacterium]